MEMIKEYRNYKNNEKNNENDLSLLLYNLEYEEKINVLIKNLDVSSYISPLKLFDYLASGSTIIATDKPAYSHILKNNFNSILISTLKTDEWVYKIKEIFNNNHNTLKIKKNALRTAKKYTWLSRCEKIINFI